MNVQELASGFLLAVKMKQDSRFLRDQLNQLSLDKLIDELKSDSQKKAFWINSYNAWFQIMKRDWHVKKRHIFRKAIIHIAGQNFSLDEIEHGILRRYRYKYSLRLIPNIFTRKLVRQLALSEIDYRIHFALNCGAKSCPPIAFYDYNNIDKQLDVATQNYLNTNTLYDDNNKIVYLSKLFHWFKYDFGSKRGIAEIYKNQIDRNISNYRFKYLKYDWEEELEKYTSVKSSI